MKGEPGWRKGGEKNSNIFQFFYCRKEVYVKCFRVPVHTVSVDINSFLVVGEVGGRGGGAKN